ncbi:DUF4412 domain-containing protein [Methylonatrum kenyense]|uniref:DUF4412 domain-containing protein n=1 Tax=Methylonatrum kenyense TaxID=455253 RepID=UPI0020BD6B26|nr:DUF4412 domain-containing protein [Methylonatrum kenyense]MCK8516362.1 DUF4412 domain-containing protein [Methylonatrum kenyense]
MHATVLGAFAGAGVFGASGAMAADYVGTYMTPDGEMTLEYRDDQNLRMLTPEGDHMLISGGSTYVVSQQDGEWVVMSMDEMLSMAGESAPVEEAEYRMNATGRTESVGGFSGEVYEVQRCDAWSGDCTADGEVVVSDDHRVANLFAGMQAMSRQMSQHDGDDVIDMPDGMEGYGLLRADGIELQSAEQTNLPDHTFALPPNHREVDPMAGMQGQGDAPPPGRGEESGDDGSQGSWFGDSARDVGRQAGEDAEDETRRGISDTVRDGVRSLFD